MPGRPGDPDVPDPDLPPEDCERIAPPRCLRDPRRRLPLRRHRDDGPLVPGRLLRRRRSRRLRRLSTGSGASFSGGRRRLLCRALLDGTERRGARRRRFSHRRLRTERGRRPGGGHGPARPGSGRTRSLLPAPRDSRARRSPRDPVDAGFHRPRHCGIGRMPSGAGAIIWDPIIRERSLPTPPLLAQRTSPVCLRPTSRRWNSTPCGTRA